MQKRHPFGRAMLIAALALLAGALAAMPARAVELLMVEQQGCTYCEMWDEEIAPIYPKTAEGRFAPLRRMDIGDVDNGEVRFARPVNFTPTFVLVRAGRELGRIEGYPGEDFFWWLLTRLLTEHSDFTPAPGAGG